MRRYAWVVFGTTWAASGTWLVLLILNRGTLAGIADLVDVSHVAGFAIVWPAAGLVLVSRRPTLPIGWLFLVSGAVAAVDAAVGELITFRAVTGSTPEPALAFLVAGLRQVSVVPIVLLLALYPDGRPLSPRWRWTALAPVLALPALLVPVGEHLTTYRGEPTGVAGVTGGIEPVLWGVGALLTYPALMGAAVGIVVRFRRSTGVLRLQLKWAAYSGLAALLVLGVSALEVPYVGDLHHVAGAVLVYGFPACVVVAILRHRLYEIDRLVSRTLSYAAVTVILVAVYAVGVLSIRSLVPGESSDLSVAGSTLAVAALFQPVRRRVQVIVDGRFNRATYDAQQVVAGFASRLRSELDLAALTDQLGRTVDRAFQPSSVSVALIRPSGGPS